MIFNVIKELKRLNKTIKNCKFKSQRIVSISWEEVQTMKKVSVFIGVVSLTLVSSVMATIPYMVNYQGTLTDEMGKLLQDGYYNMTFRIYDVPTGGSPLWQESQSVWVTRGLFHVWLGSTNPIILPFNRNYWLGVQVESDPEMEPRHKLTSVGYTYMAENSDMLDSLHASYFIHSVDGVHQDAGNIDLEAGHNIVITPDDLNDKITIDEPFDIVSSVDGVFNNGGDVDLVAGSNIEIIPNDEDNTITISATGVVTEIVAGEGLYEDDLRYPVTLNVGGGKGIVVDEDSVHVNPGSGLWISNDEVRVGEGDGIDVLADAVKVDVNDFAGDGLGVDNNDLIVNVGAGLYISSDEVNIGDGNGIVVSADAVDVGQGDGIRVSANDVRVEVSDFAGSGLGVEGTNDLKVNTGHHLTIQGDAVAVVPEIVSSVDGVANDGGNIDLVPGSDITIVPNDGNNTITFNVQLPTIVSSVDGVMNDRGNIDLVPGKNISITPDDANNRITIAEPYDVVSSIENVHNNGGNIDLVPQGNLITITGNDAQNRIYFSVTGDGYNPDNTPGPTTRGEPTRNELSSWYVDEGQLNSITTTMIVDSTIKQEDLEFSVVKSVTAGDGLIGGGTEHVTLDVGQGPGISVSSNTVALADTVTKSIQQAAAFSAINTALTGYGLYGDGDYGGVKGYSYGGSGSAGVVGTSQYGAGVYGESDNGLGGLFRSNNPNEFAAAIKSAGENPWNWGLRVDGKSEFNSAEVYFTRNIKVDGNLIVGGSKNGYVSEICLNGGSEPLYAGDVVMITGTDDPVVGEIPVIKVKKSDRREITSVVGVVDQRYDLHAHFVEGIINPGNYLGVVTHGSFKSIAVDASYAPIKVGDLLTSSDTPGYAMKAINPKPGTIIGKALESLNSGKGYIKVLVTLQ